MDPNQQYNPGPGQPEAPQPVNYGPQPPQPQPGPQPQPPAGYMPPPQQGVPPPQAFPTNPTSIMQPEADDSDEDTSGKKRIFIIIGIVVGALVLFVVSMLIGLSIGKGSVEPTEGNSQVSQEAGPRPATAIDIEQANNFISQDLSSINDDRDFPENALDDKSLGL